MEMKKTILTTAIALFLLMLGATVTLSQSVTDASMEIARTRFKRGLVLFNNYSYLGAVEHFRSALTVYPQYHLSREYLARSYRLAGYTDSALTEWQLLYDISDDISVKNKIDMINYMRSSLPFDNREMPEYVETNRVNSNELSYYRFPYPTDIAADKNKNLYIASFNTGKIVKLSHEGEGKAVRRLRQNSKIYSIDVNDTGIVFTDFGNDIIYTADFNLEITGSFGSKGSGNGQFNGLQGISIHDDGSIFAVDSGNHRVQKFTSDGVYLLQFGKRGNYDENLMNPTDIVSHNDVVYITDTDNSRISVFDTSGNYLREIVDDALVSPRGINIHEDLLYISDSKTGLVVIDPVSGYTEIMDKWNNDEESFSRLYSTTVDRDGFLYAIDHDKQMMFTFSPVEKTYTNIDVEIRSVDTESYPFVAFFISVRNRGGEPLFNLSPENFTVIEDNAPIKKLTIDYLKKQTKFSHIIFCIDRSASMEKWHEEIEWSADFYLKEMNVEDRVKTVNVNETDWTANEFDWSRRRTLQALRDKSYSGDVDLGRVVYNSISELVTNENSRAVVIFTDGSSGFNSFKQYSSDVVIDYARAHYIPLYFVSVDKENSELESIAEKTGGQFILAKKTEEMKELYGRIRNQEEYRYVVVYESFKSEEFSGWWSDVTIDIQSQGRRGREWGGYYVP
jgi:tetratricopeptide (TPR) repeat protein